MAKLKTENTTEVHKMTQKEAKQLKLLSEQTKAVIIENPSNQNVRPNVMNVFKKSIIDNWKLGQWLAK
jgi:cystathionine beta-lyase/cystathionine gamma-synthase